MLPGVGDVCAHLVHVWEGFRLRNGSGLCRFDARMIEIQAQDWVRILQVWSMHEMDSDAGVGDVCAGLVHARMRRIQTQEWVRFVQVWCTHDRDSGAGVSDVCACLMLPGVGDVCADLVHVWEGFRHRNGSGLCRFYARMIWIQAQDWVRILQVWCMHEMDTDAGVGDVCADLVHVWEGFRHRNGLGFCRFDARMIGIQAQEWVRFVQVWCMHEMDSDAGVGDVCADLVHVWEGFRHSNGLGLCRFGARMRRIQTQEWVRFVQVWCTHDRDSGAGVSDVCAGLMHAWDGFRRRSGRCLCRFGARMRWIQTQEWVRFVQIWCLYEKDSDTEWVRFVQVWCMHDKDSDAGLGDVCAGLMLPGVGDVCAGLMHAW